MAKKKKFYVVWQGLAPGVYGSWTECQRQIKNYQGARYKSFPSKEIADRAFIAGPDAEESKNAPKEDLTKAELERIGKPIMPSLSVDAACSGNPGIMEYQGVNTYDKTLWFHNGPYPDATVNIGEFLALVHGLALLKKQKSNIPIYSDSRTAMSWVRRKKANTKLQPTSKNKELFNLIERAEYWIKNNTWSNPILKWETKAWGEIPADFGRK